MRLLLDANLSYRLVKILTSSNVGVVHVSDIGMANASDMDIWQYAGQEDLIIVTFDSDFRDLSMLHGTPPKVVHLVTGNMTTKAIAGLLLSKVMEIRAFSKQPKATILALHGN